jgi:hypothetical protein
VTGVCRPVRAEIMNTRYLLWATWKKKKSHELVNTAKRQHNNGNNYKTVDGVRIHGCGGREGNHWNSVTRLRQTGKRSCAPRSHMFSTLVQIQYAQLPLIITLVKGQLVTNTFPKLFFLRGDRDFYKRIRAVRASSQVVFYSTDTQTHYRYRRTEKFVQLDRVLYSRARFVCFIANSAASDKRRPMVGVGGGRKNLQ